jgi:signal transduction histidine kinase
LFRVAQEALSNVKKHSGAEEAVVQLHGSSDEIVLSIVDAGIGFDPGKASSNGGLGLRSMQERLRAVGGTVEIDSQKGGGTQILVRAPLSLAVAVSQS